eukprot:EG_transcript_9561
MPFLVVSLLCSKFFVLAWLHWAGQTSSPGGVEEPPPQNTIEKNTEENPEEGVSCMFVAKRRKKLDPQNDPFSSTASRSKPPPVCVAPSSTEPPQVRFHFQGRSLPKRWGGLPPTHYGSHKRESSAPLSIFKISGDRVEWSKSGFFEGLKVHLNFFFAEKFQLGRFALFWLGAGDHLFQPGPARSPEHRTPLPHFIQFQIIFGALLPGEVTDVPPQI